MENWGEMFELISLRKGKGGAEKKGLTEKEKGRKEKERRVLGWMEKKGEKIKIGKLELVKYIVGTEGKGSNE